MLKFQNYVRAKTLEEAWELNQSKRNRILGGMMWLKMSNNTIGTAIDLCDLGLDKIEENDEEFSIGAMVTLRDIEMHAGLNEYTQNAVKKAVQDIVGVQFRNTATVGGSIFGRFGFSDVLTVFLAMDSYVELYKGGVVSMEQFAQSERDNDILVRVIVKKRQGEFAYHTMRNTRTDFPVIACAVSCMEGEYKASVGARPSKAIIIRDDKNILGNGVTEETSAAFAQYVSENAPTQSNVRGSGEYRTHLIKVLVQRALEEVKGEQ